MLKVSDLSVRYGSLTLLDRVGFSVQAGQWLMIVGPNGAGKSTLINAISQCAPYTGRVLFEGADVGKSKPRELARRMGVLMQHQSVGYAFTVRQIVEMGRYAYAGGLFGSGGNDDKAHILRALEMTGLTGMQEQSALTLSGGELQRTFLAQVFAQNPRLLLLDEPSNHLDLVYQEQVFGLIADWLRQPQRAVVSVVHDLSLAKAYGTHALLLNGGTVQSFGPMDDVLTRQNLQTVYHTDVYARMQAMLSQWEEKTE